MDWTSKSVVLPEPVLFCLNILNVYVSNVCHNNLLREILQTEGFMQKECSLLYVWSDIINPDNMVR